MSFGGSVIGFAEQKVSSVARGETLADTIRSVEISTDVNETSHVLYFMQMRHGICVRINLLALVLGAL